MNLKIFFNKDLHFKYFFYIISILRFLKSTCEQCTCAQIEYFNLVNRSDPTCCTNCSLIVHISYCKFTMMNFQELMMMKWWKNMKINFHPNENIEWHCLQLELILIQIQLKLDEIEFKNIEWNSNFIGIDLKFNWIGFIFNWEK
jgi:hypothetical protein